MGYWGDLFEKGIDAGINAIQKHNEDDPVPTGGNTSSSQEKTEENYDRTIGETKSALAMLKNNQELFIMGGLGIVAVLTVILLIKK